MTKPSNEPSAHYDRVTRSWGYLLGEDLHYGWFTQGGEPLSEATTALTRQMAALAAFQPGAAVLDVGCGTGSPACHVAAHYGVSVLGISTSVEGISAAKERAARLDLSERVRFEVRNGMNNGLPSNGFDRVWVMESSHLMDDKAALLRECARALRPGGRLVLCDVIRRRELPLGEVLRHAKEFALLRNVYGRAKMISLADYEGLAAEAGLTPVSSQDISAPTQPTFDRWRDNAARHREEVVALVGEDYLDAFAQSCDVLDRFWSDGTLGYGLFAAEKPA
ncbi:MAG: class I SAM-dependent methyltransferase [Deltaproteobacteria bacterium]|nr:class I SAM-dependent methyltransferase [Deltaproteobacteria bacterium]